MIAAWNAANPTRPIAFQPINTALFVQGGQKYNAQDQSAVRLSLLWELSPALHWNLSYERYMDRGTPGMNLMQNPRPGQDRWSALIDTAPSLKRDSNSVRSRVDWAINSDIALAYIAGWSSYRGSSTYDQDGGAVTCNGLRTTLRVLRRTRTANEQLLLPSVSSNARGVTLSSIGGRTSIGAEIGITSSCRAGPSAKRASKRTAGR